MTTPFRLNGSWQPVVSWRRLRWLLAVVALSWASLGCGAGPGAAASGNAEKQSLRRKGASDASEVGDFADDSASTSPKKKPADHDIEVPPAP